MIARGSCWLLALALFGCASQPKPTAVHREGLCFMARDRSVYAQPLHAHDWVKLLVQLELGQGGVFALRDCTGRAIEWKPSQDQVCSGETLESESPTPSPISRDAVFERSLGGGEYLLWIVSHHFANGDGFGPVALARRLPDGIAIEAIGDLRMRRERVNLELWTIQKKEVVVASGETCNHDVGAESCQRAARLLVHRADALLDAPMIDPSGQCVQTASIELARRHEQTLSSGMRRSFELTSSVSHDARYVVIEERLVVRDTDPNSPLLPPREVQHIEANRFVSVQDGRLLSRQHPLWTRALSQTNEQRRNAARN
ncbi:MAG TPA: hypothetical protein VHZ95_17270 [Polyangiales bacterium]|nr:hypothetical protein [Polyangiales bacterium]